MRNFTCQRCASPFEVEEMPRRGLICFACHVKTVNIGFSYGKSDFHGPTIGERQRKAVADARINGYNPEPVGTRWV
jgi:hypothetical protein